MTSSTLAGRRGVESVHTFSHLGFSYVAVLPNRASYGAGATGQPERPSVKAKPAKEVRPEDAALRGPTLLAMAFALLAAVVLLAVAIFAGSQAPTAAAEEPGHAGAPEESTAVSDWSQGTLPHLYQANQGWAYAPFGGSTVGEAGSAPTSLCMVYVKETGSRAYTPAGFAAFGNEQNLTSHDVEGTLAYLHAGAEAFGLAAAPVEQSALALRQALGRGCTVIALMPDPVADGSVTCAVIDDVNEDSALAVIDPANAERVPEEWGFDELLGSAVGLLALQAA